jgi:hypothetical protein
VIAAEVLLFIAGLAIVLIVADAAIRTLIVPRPSRVTLTAATARATRFAFDLVARFAKTYEGRDRVMAPYGPVTLITFSLVWLTGILIGFGLMYFSITGLSWGDSFTLSGSALLTLGFAVPQDPPAITLVFVEAAAGLLLVALLIAYLPTIYSAFSHREITVNQLSVRAGTPPSPTELLIRAHRAGFSDELDDMFIQWETWFVEVEETQTSLAILNFFRSPNPHRSWVTASGVMLDTAALRMSTLNVPFSPKAGLCIRAGYLSLRSIADFFGVQYDRDPDPDDEIMITREEFEEVYVELAEAGLPVIADRDKAWRDFKGWRVNYDCVLLTLAELIMAPYAPWVSDRPAPGKSFRPPVRSRKRDNNQTIR